MLAVLIKYGSNNNSNNNSNKRNCAKKGYEPNKF